MFVCTTQTVHVHVYVPCANAKFAVSAKNILIVLPYIIHVQGHLSKVIIHETKCKHSFGLKYDYQSFQHVIPTDPRSLLPLQNNRKHTCNMDYKSYWTGQIHVYRRIFFQMYAKIYRLNGHLMAITMTSLDHLIMLQKILN